MEHQIITKLIIIRLDEKKIFHNGNYININMLQFMQSFVYFYLYWLYIYLF